MVSASSAWTRFRRIYVSATVTDLNNPTMGRPVINSRLQFLRADHHTQVSDLAPGESRAIIHTGGPISSELSVVLNSFGKRTVSHADTPLIVDLADSPQA
jgi:hypothetical protein